MPIKSAVGGYVPEVWMVLISELYIRTYRVCSRRTANFWKQMPMPNTKSTSINNSPLSDLSAQCPTIISEGTGTSTPLPCLRTTGDTYRGRTQRSQRTNLNSFPSTWPIHTPAAKLTDWLEGYASFLELDVWTSSTITKTSWNDSTKTWTV
ncbi:hypothetical protein BDR04DRAFT_37435 [Suillus decipiens]|nr:hypothetical protein BDR04DRAFT_37435 [Suillus decipiens]